jgi:hypothetical protein
MVPKLGIAAVNSPMKPNSLATMFSARGLEQKAAKITKGRPSISSFAIFASFCEPRSERIAQLDRVVECHQRSGFGDIPAWGGALWLRRSAYPRLCCVTPLA